MKYLHKKMKFEINLLVSVIALLTLNCSKDSSDFNAGYLSAYPENGGTISIDPMRDSYEEGERVKLIAIPYYNRKFYKWTGDANSYDSILDVEIGQEPKLYRAVFPAMVLNGGKIFIGNFPPHVINKGEYAEFDFCLDLPESDTYTLSCRCSNYNDVLFSFNATEKSCELKAGCAMDTSAERSAWRIVVSSNTTDSTVFDTVINYSVTWMEINKTCIVQRKAPDYQFGAFNSYTKGYLKRGFGVQKTFICAPRSLEVQIRTPFCEKKYFGRQKRSRISISNAKFG